MKRKILVLSVLAVLSLCSQVRADDLTPDLLNKGKMDLKVTIWGYDYFYEKNPTQSFSVGLFYPDQLQEAVKPVTIAFQKAEESKNDFLLGYFLAFPSGAFLGAALAKQDPLYLGIGIIGTLWCFLEDINGQLKMGHAVYLYNQAIEKEQLKEKNR